ncbi:MAG TPA: phosphodiester glycosidase family protein [Flavipsychrobacter sp.]|nr:phosphodiester glycosidase family protein [Flavipsychrobacter sp.]
MSKGTYVIKSYQLLHFTLPRFSITYFYINTFMKHFFTFLFVVASITAFAQARRIKHAGNTFDVYIATPQKDNIQTYWKNHRGEKLISLTNLKKNVEQKGKELVFATNAGIYLEDNSPQGLYVENGKELRPLDTKKKKSNANFYMQPNGVFLLTKTGAKVVVTEEYKTYKSQTVYATQSGPMLVINGKINSIFRKGSANNGYIRSGVGINDKGEVVFAISNGPSNFYDFATLFRDILRCDNALYLDGAICRSYIPSLKRLQLGGNFGAMIGVTK